MLRAIRLALEPAADIFQRRPARIFYFSGAGTLFLVQILAALRTQPLAVCAAGNLQRQREQNLLTQHILKQKTFSLIIADLGFGNGDRELILAGISAKRTIQKLEFSFNLLRHRFQAAGALQFQPRRQAPSQPDVFDYLVLAMMLLNYFCMP